VVHARIRRIVGQDAPDLVQELFVRFLRSEPEERKVAPWILSTSTSLAIDRLRQRVRRDSDWPEQVREAARADQDLSALLDNPELLRRVLAELPPGTQEVVVLVRFEELTRQEAAVALGLTAEAVDTHMRRFEERARQLVKAWQA
jgi:RNA polymerase sigma factor (sigma-70 family)